MKTLVNKDNPAFRITTPEIIEEEEYYTFDGETIFLKEYWNLVEEEPKNTEVWLEGRTIFEQEGEPTEWSEEDEAMRDNILRLLSCFVGTLECDSNPSLSTSYQRYQREIDWLKSLNPQPKQDWIKEQTKGGNK